MAERAGEGLQPQAHELTAHPAGFDGPAPGGTEL